jgi:hypothetical protein
MLCLPTAPTLPTEGSGDFGTSPLYGQLSGKPRLVFNEMGWPDAKHNSGSRSLALNTFLPSGVTALLGPRRSNISAEFGLLGVPHQFE